MKKFSLVIFTCGLLVSVHVVAGSPVGFAQPVAIVADTDVADDTTNAGMSAQNGTSTDDSTDDSALVMITDKTSAGWVSDFIIQKMTDQCAGNTAPAIQFFGCIANTTNLPAVWAAMGMNTTVLSLHTVEATVVRGNNVTDDKDVSIDFLQEGDSSAQNSTTIQDLMRIVSAQSSSFCQNSDGLLNCLDAYLSSCYADSEDDNTVPDPSTFKSGSRMDRSSDDVVPDDDSTTDGSDAASNGTTTDAAAVTDQDTNAVQQSFFMIPFLDTQSRIYPLMQEALSTVCADQATPLKSLIQSVPCLFQSMEDAQKSCPFCQNLPSGEPADSSTLDSEDATSTAVDGETCSAWRNCMECQIDVVAQTCGEDLADTVHHLVQSYFNALQCFPDSNGDSIRAPFNVAIL